MKKIFTIVVSILLASLVALPLTAVAENSLEITIIDYSDGSDGILYGIVLNANKDGATTFEITSPSGTFNGSKVGDEFIPEQLFFDSLTDITFAKLTSEMASDWTLVWDKGLATETVAIIRFRTFGTLMESDFLAIPTLTSPLNGATDISPNTSIDWTYDVPVADAQQDLVEVLLFGPTDPGLVSGEISDLIKAVLFGPNNLLQSSDELPLEVTSWTPPAPLHSGTWVAISANGNTLLDTADGLGGPITGDPWILENEDWLGVSSINVAVFTIQTFGPFLINAAISDAWFFPDTSGQGFFIIVWEDLKLIFLSWFTYETERPPENITAILGEPGHRWLTALGPFDGDTAVLDVFLSSGMIFNSADPVVDSVQLEGATIEIVWTSCNVGVLKYDIPSLGLSGEIPIQRIVLDHVQACIAAQPQ